MSASYHIVLLHLFRRLLEDAHRQGIDIAPLKGADLITRFYPLNEDRGPMCDVDFLVRPDHLNALGDLLTQHGFSRRDDGPVTHEQSFEILLDNRGRILFEAHIHLFEPRRFPRIDTDGIWHRARPGNLDGAPCFRLSPEDVFCHVALHSAVHGFDSLARDLNDLSHVARATDATDVTQRARQWGITRVVWLMLTLLFERHVGFDSDAARRELRPPFPADRALLRAARLKQISSHRARMALLLPLIFDTPAAAVTWLVGHPAFRR